MTRRSLGLALALSTFALMVPMTAGASVRLGPDLSTVPNGNALGCQGGTFSPCAWITYSSTNPEAPAVSPINGVVTAWRFRAGCCDPMQTESRTMTLKTFKPGSGSGYVYMDPVKTGPSFVIPAGNSVNSDPAVELPAHLPIAIGQSIGIVADYPIEFATYSMPNTSFTILFNNFIYGSPYGGAMAISADVEPDADGDGYGDETQDCQTADPSQHGTECIPPPSPPPPPPPPVYKPGGHCEGVCGGGATFGGSPHPIPTPRGDGGIEIQLECPPRSTSVCGGILYAELPGGAKKSSAGSSKAAAAMILAKTSYTVKPGKKKKLDLVFSRKTISFLAQKRTRRVTVTIDPKVGRSVSTTQTLKYPKPKRP